MEHKGQSLAAPEKHNLRREVAVATIERNLVLHRIPRRVVEPHDAGPAIAIASIGNPPGTLVPRLAADSAASSGCRTCSARPAARMLR